MIKKALYFLKMWLCRLRYGNKVEFAGVPICEQNAHFVVKGEAPAHSIVLPENKARLTFVPIEEKL